MAIAAVDELSGAIVGLSEYVQTSDQACVAEVAVVVVDELQGQGVGAALATRAMQRACSTGFARLTATTLWENRAAHGLLRRLGFRAQASNGREIEHLLELNCEQGGQHCRGITHPAPSTQRTPT